MSSNFVRHGRPVAWLNIWDVGRSNSWLIEVGKCNVAIEIALQKLFYD